MRGRAALAKEGSWRGNVDRPAFACSVDSALPGFPQTVSVLRQWPVWRRSPRSRTSADFLSDTASSQVAQRVRDRSGKAQERAKPRHLTVCHSSLSFTYFTSAFTIFCLCAMLRTELNETLTSFTGGNMAYQMTIDEKSVFEKGQFANKLGNTECVEFVRHASNAPHTTMWKKGVRILAAKPGAILRGTVIATFDEQGRYPTDGKGRHAVVYLSHTMHGIEVLDQWNAQGRVLRRTIRIQPSDRPRSNAAQTFFIVE